MIDNYWGMHRTLEGARKVAIENGFYQRGKQISVSALPLYGLLITLIPGIYIQKNKPLEL
jgi:hypothetical protein